MFCGFFLNFYSIILSYNLTYKFTICAIYCRLIYPHGNSHHHSLLLHYYYFLNGCSPLFSFTIIPICFVPFFFGKQIPAFYVTCGDTSSILACVILQ